MGKKFMYMDENLTGAPNLLAGLSDVDISTTPQDGDTLIYNATSGKWEKSDIVSEINSNMTLTKETLATGLTLYRMGKMRLLKVYAYAPISGGVLYTLAAADRPDTLVYTPVTVGLTGKVFTGYMGISTAGGVTARYYVENATSSDWACPTNSVVTGCIMWFTA